MASSPADRQVEANEQVETLAQALYGVEKEMVEENLARAHRRSLRASWEMAPESRRAFLREFARRILIRDLVRPGKGLPEPAPRQIEGQQSMLDEPMFPLPDLDPDLREGLDP